MSEDFTWLNEIQPQSFKPAREVLIAKIISLAKQYERGKLEPRGTEEMRHRFASIARYEWEWRPNARRTVKIGDREATQPEAAVITIVHEVSDGFPPLDLVIPAAVWQAIRQEMTEEDMVLLSTIEKLRAVIVAAEQARMILH